MEGPSSRRISSTTIRSASDNVSVGGARGISVSFGSRRKGGWHDAITIILCCRRQGRWHEEIATSNTLVKSAAAYWYVISALIFARLKDRSSNSFKDSLSDTLSITKGGMKWCTLGWWNIARTQPTIYQTESRRQCRWNALRAALPPIFHHELPLRSSSSSFARSSSSSFSFASLRRSSNHLSRFSSSSSFFVIRPCRSNNCHNNFLRSCIIAPPS